MTVKKEVKDVKIRSLPWNGSLAVFTTGDRRKYVLERDVDMSQIKDYNGGIENPGNGGKTFLYLEEQVTKPTKKNDSIYSSSGSIEPLW